MTNKKTGIKRAARGRFETGSGHEGKEKDDSERELERNRIHFTVQAKNNIPESEWVKE